MGDFKALQYNEDIFSKYSNYVINNSWRLGFQYYYNKQ